MRNEDVKSQQDFIHHNIAIHDHINLYTPGLQVTPALVLEQNVYSYVV